MTYCVEKIDIVIKASANLNKRDPFVVIVKQTSSKIPFCR